MPIWQPEVPPTPVALSHDTEHEPTRKLLGQCAHGAAVPELEIRMGSGHGISQHVGGHAGYQLLPDDLLQLAAASSTQ